MAERNGSLESMVVVEFWKKRKVLITGHTGFKGSWLLLFLQNLGAEVFGYALNTDTNPALFKEAELSDYCHHAIGDVQDYSSMQKRVLSVKPDIIFHLAAQSLVRRSYDEPLETWRTNVLGTVNLLESLKLLKNRCAVVIVTTDKVYENREWHYAYRESDTIGGHDPYSASKASVELALASWRCSFFNMSGSQVRLASARAGNVIGGGDWSKDRIVPDMIRYLNDETAIPVRNPNAMRPWQHVLEPLKGYLLLAQSLYKSDDIELQSAFNFGPGSNSIRTVKNLVEEGLKHWPGRWDNLAQYDAPHEAKLLKLTSAKARSLLEWEPQWDFEQAVQYTIDWYRRSNQGELAIELMNEQIDDYLSK